MNLNRIFLADGTALSELAIGQPLYRDNLKNDRPDVIEGRSWSIHSDYTKDNNAMSVRIYHVGQGVTPTQLFTAELGARNAVAQRMEQAAISARRAAIDAAARTAAPTPTP
jgi:hypothetical protein